MSDETLTIKFPQPIVDTDGDIEAVELDVVVAIELLLRWIEDGEAETFAADSGMTIWRRGRWLGYRTDSVASVQSYATEDQAEDAFELLVLSLDRGVPS